MSKTSGPYDAYTSLKLDGATVQIASLPALEDAGLLTVDEVPISIRVLLESVLRNVDGETITKDDVARAASWRPDVPEAEVPFMPARVILQDFTGVPAVVDLAALRSAAERAGKDPAVINPLVPCDLVIDHSVQVDFFGGPQAFDRNVDLEYQRNGERYQFLKWSQKAFRAFRVVPPGTGIVHQVNLEHLADVVRDGSADGARWAYPDTLVGTDSHTTMIGGIGVVGWGVGGIEAEAVMLGQPYFMKLPDVIGVRLEGELPEGATATDLVLYITELLRKVGVVDKFVEFTGPGLAQLTVADRATIANMAPEQGSTISFFPVDEATLDYLRLTGRPEAVVQRVEAYSRANKLFRTAVEPKFTKLLEVDLATIQPSLAGPRRPQDRVPLPTMKRHFRKLIQERYKDEAAMLPTTSLGRWLAEGGGATATATAGAPHPDPDLGRLTRKVPVTNGRDHFELTHGSAVIAAITSCTNTSNPTVMVGAGLLARNAVDAGLNVPAWVKTSMAPGSRVVTEYLTKADLLKYLEQLRFHVVGYGCTTCIGNSGPLAEPIEKAIEDNDLVVAAVLSGNRNFEARIHSLVRANYLASPPLVVAYALAGRVDIDLATEPLGTGTNGKPVFLKDIWPTLADIRATISRCLDPSMFQRKYASVFEGDARWQKLPVPESLAYEWTDTSTYVREPPFFQDFPLAEPKLADVKGARVLLVLGDSVTTDHISPAGAFDDESEAGRWLIEQGVAPKDFNTYGSRRGNHEVMMRGTFANVRIKNQLLKDVEGGHTIHFPTGKQMTVYQAAMKYQAEGTPLVVLAGKEYGSGSSRDWAAKGTALLGVKAVIAESYERIHRSNLIGMGVLPLEFKPGESAASLGLTGDETFSIDVAKGLKPKQKLAVTATPKTGAPKKFDAVCRLDTATEIRYYQNGGILHYVLRRMLSAA